MTVTMQALLPAFSFLAILFLILIIPGQLKSNTIPAVSVITWLFVCNLIHAANSIVWADNARVQAQVWCDICEQKHHHFLAFALFVLLAATKILLGAMVAVPGALFCISRQLEILTSRFEHTKMPTLRHKIIVESLMCIVFPILYMSLRKLYSILPQVPLTLYQIRLFSSVVSASW